MVERTLEQCDVACLIAEKDARALLACIVKGWKDAQTFIKPGEAFLYNELGGSIFPVFRYGVDRDFYKISQ